MPGSPTRYIPGGGRGGVPARRQSGLARRVDQQHREQCDCGRSPSSRSSGSSITITAFADASRPAWCRCRYRGQIAGFLKIIHVWAGPYRASGLRVGPEMAARVSAKRMAIRTYSDALASSSTIGSMPIRPRHRRHLPRSANQLNTGTRSSGPRRSPHEPHRLGGAFTEPPAVPDPPRPSGTSRSTDRRRPRPTTTSSSSTALRGPTGRLANHVHVRSDARITAQGHRRLGCVRPPPHGGPACDRPFATASWSRSRTSPCSPPRRWNAWCTRCSTSARSPS